MTSIATFAKDNYYPTYFTGCEPIHEVKDWAYVRKLVKAARAGEEINPILIFGEKGSGWLMAGTHRAAANDILMMLGEEPLIEYMTVEEAEEEGLVSDDLREAIENNDFETIDWIWDQKK